jgi:glucose-6-phosphate dehydrogenase assembly protein OpcA
MSQQATIRTGIDPEAIEKRLRQAWMEVGASAEEQGLPPPIRSHLMNLVVVSFGASDAARSRAVFEHLAESLPSRVIHITLDEAEGLAATASAHCPITSKHRHTCYEIININAGMQDMPAIPSVITRLAISDLETCIWWTSPVDFDDPAFRRISNAGDRVIVDTMASPDAPATLAAFNRFLNDPATDVAGADLAWGRLITFRELIAQSFDIEAARSIIPDIRRIEISASSGWESSAILAACWMSARLGLQPSAATSAPGAIVLTALNAAEIPVQIRLLASSEEYGLQSVRITAHSASRSSRVTIRTLDHERAVVNVDITGQPRQERIVSCLKCDEVQLLGEELALFSGDPMFIEALDQAAAFAGFLLNEREQP